MPRTIRCESALILLLCPCLQYFLLRCRLTELFSLSEPSLNTEAHVVFVHGLDGDSRRTWMAKDAAPDQNFPHWIADDLGNARVWLLGYDAAKSNWTGDGMFLIDRGENVYARLLVEPALSTGQIFFVAHSLGGHVVKQLLRIADRDQNVDPKAFSFLNRVKKIAFLGTPHRGSLLADILNKIPGARSSSTASDLTLGNPGLRDLHRWYRRRLQSLPVEELTLIEGRTEKFGFLSLPKWTTVVHPDSADSGSPKPAIMVEESHTTLPKPKARDSEVYVLVLNFLREEVLGTDVGFETRRTLLSSIAPATLSGNVRPADKAEVYDRAELTGAAATARLASVDLLRWPKDIMGNQMDRAEHGAVLSRIEKEPGGCTLLIGEAGSGKSALLSSVTAQLLDRGVGVLAVKADLLSENVETLEDIASELGVTESLGAVVDRLRASGPAVLVIDQLDAVSSVMDRKSARMRLLMRLANGCLEKNKTLPDTNAVHVIVSSRPFEADHDARFQQLGSKRITLALPSAEAVLGFLGDLDIDPAKVPPAMIEIIRRPFALKLFVEMVHRGAEIDGLLPGQLLQRWLDTADMGGDRARRDVLSFLSRLAQDMIETETLWRPIDNHLVGSEIELRTAQSTGIIVANDRGQIGFSHQSWLDDFQAKIFTDADVLLSHALRGQDSLFSRATILRGLQRFRQGNPIAYEKAVDAIIQGPSYRRHLKHLVSDLIASTGLPSVREKAWVDHLIRTDHRIARRIIPAIARNWSVWRDALRPMLSGLMIDAELKWPSSMLLKAEAALDLGSAMDLLESCWKTKDYDSLVLRFLDDDGRWHDRIRHRFKTVLQRSEVADHFLSRKLSQWVDDGRVEDALDLVALYFETGDVTKRTDAKIYDLNKLAAATPSKFAQRLASKFVERALLQVEPPRRNKDAFPKSVSLPWDWRDQFDQEVGFLQVISSALTETANADHTAARAIIAELTEIEVEEIQETVANMYASDGCEFANEAFSFFISDSRRFDLGSVFRNDAQGVGHLVHGWSSKRLLSSIVPHLTESQLRDLKKAVDTWARFQAEDLSEIPLKDRRSYIKWSAEARYPLLECLPVNILGARLDRQIKEWRRDEPVIVESRSLRMTEVVSPMSATAMERATDDQILERMKRHEGIDADYSRSTGGMRELAPAFAAFAKNNVERASAIIRRLTPGKHDYACGAAIREIADAPAEVGNARVLIYDTWRMGFRSSEWIGEIAWALLRAAESSKGLPDADIELLTSLVVRDKGVIKQQIEQRLENEKQTRRAEYDRKSNRVAMLFGRGGGVKVLPHRNFPVIAAIAAGCLFREPPDVERWMSFLEAHSGEPEDPEIWANLLRRYGNVLFNVERTRAESFLRSLINACPKIFDQADKVQLLWTFRSLLDKHALRSICRIWLDGDDYQQQAAGEFIAGALVVDNQTEWLEDLVDEVDKQPSPSSARIGILLTASAGWVEAEVGIRTRSSGLIKKYAANCNVEDEAMALTSIGWQRSLPADPNTTEMLSMIARNHLLAKCLSGARFNDALQSLLNHPGFEKSVLDVVETLVAVVEGHTENRIRTDGDLVQICVSLQRSDGPLRAEAMNLYERLLDAEAAGAFEAAASSLDRKH